MKDRTILAVKGLAIIGVVLHHIYNRRFDPQAAAGVNLLSGLFDWCVLAFFCVSGYLQALSDSKKHRSLAEFTRLRFMRLIVPWVVLAVFYACIWQLIQALHVSNIGVKVPPDFPGKLKDVFWPIESQVAQQLYFFPILFAVSLTLMLIHLGLRVYGMWAAAIVAAGVGTVYFPLFTSFSWDVFVWGICFYASGYLLFHYRVQKTAIRLAILAFSVVVIAMHGAEGVIRCVPLWLIAEGATIRLDRVPLLVPLGEASGTIYIYHTPFLMQPLVIAATLLHGPVAQFAGGLLAAAVATAICYALFELLKNTRAKILLM